MSDRFLNAHELRPLIFDISTALRPGSIRDQIVRGSLLATRAFERGLINPTDADLLVVGAGVAGASCALVSARLGVRTTLVDLMSPFSRQRACTTKRIEPTFYDWPAAHWDKHQFPWNGEGSTLALLPLRASDMAQLWEKELRAEARRGRLKLLLNTTLDSVPQPTANGYRSELVTLDPATRARVAADAIESAIVVFATGPGVERDIDTPNGLRSFRFWEPDPLAEDPLGCTTMVISGGGDGALQDFLRAVFRPDVYLAQLVNQLDLAGEVDECATLDAQATAAFVWWGSRRDIHDSEVFIHNELAGLADRLWSRSATRISEAFSASRREHLPRIVLVHPCTHFHRSFLVNRLLTLLVLRWARETGISEITYVPQARVAMPVSCDHEAPGERRDGYACFQRPHNLACYAADCFGEQRGTARFAATACDLVLLRHGIDAHPPFADVLAPDNRLLQQLLPAHLSHDSLLRRVV